MPVEPAVTVLLSSYNGARFLPQQLASLNHQSFPEWSLLWRDDGSADDTPALLRAAPRAREAVTFGRLGVLHSFMALLREGVATPFVAFCDQDDVWLPQKLDRAVTALRDIDGPALYCARQILVDAELRRLGESPPVRHVGFPAALTQNIAAGCTIVMNRRAADLVAGSDPPSGSLHDWWSYLLVAAAGGRVVADREPTILYRQHGGNAVGAAGSRLVRARAAWRRGPATFMNVLRAHVLALHRHDALLSPRVRSALKRIDAGLSGGIAHRLVALREPGMLRQTALETAVFRLWFVLG